MARTKKKMGRKLARLPNTRRLIQETFPNMKKNKRIGMLIVLRPEMKEIGKKFECAVVQSNEVMSLGLVQYGNFLRFLGIWFLIAAIQGPA
jgi:hypothetical protein